MSNRGERALTKLTTGGASWRRSKVVNRASTTGIVAGLTLRGALFAGATTSDPPTTKTSHGARGHHLGTPPVAFGTVVATSFTTTTHGGSTVTVDVTATTTYRDEGVSSPSLATVTVGEKVAVFGTEIAGNVTATSVAIGVPRGPGGPGGFGPVR